MPGRWPKPEIDARIRKLRGFRFGGDAREIFVAPQKFFTRGAHFRIGLHTENPIAVIEKKFAENSGARADVCDYVLPGQAALLLQNADESLRVAWAVPHVVRYAIGEALFGVGESHQGNCLRKRTSF